MITRSWGTGIAGHAERSNVCAGAQATDDWQLVSKTERIQYLVHAKNGDLLISLVHALVLLSGITSELVWARTQLIRFFHHLHCMHLEKLFKLPLSCNNTCFPTKIVLEEDAKREKKTDWAWEKAAMHLMLSQCNFVMSRSMRIQLLQILSNLLSRQVARDLPMGGADDEVTVT